MELTSHSKIKMSSIAIIVIFMLSACSFSWPFREEPNTAATNNIQQEMRSKTQSVEQLNKPGMIHIQRHTKEYSISMVLDASDENIYFVMDLPQDEIDPARQEDEKQEDEKPEENTEEDAETSAENEIDTKNIDETRASKYVLYAQTYFFEKKYSRALEEVIRATEYSPNSAIAYSLKGSIHYKLGKPEDAQKAWEKALALDATLHNVKTMLEQLDK